MTDKHTTITELQTRFCLSELNVARWYRIHFQLNPESILEDERLTEYLFYRIEEMTDEKAAVHRVAMSNEITNMSDSRATLLYMQLSDGQGIHFYISVASNDNGVVHNIGNKLERAFSSNLLGAELAAVKPQGIAPITSLLSMKRLGVEMFCNLLAAVRKYGEGLIIADQIPNKLIPDVIKNTHTKIVHRLFSAVDRNLYLRTINRC